jgi:hypothetical protein
MFSHGFAQAARLAAKSDLMCYTSGLLQQLVEYRGGDDEP